ncbi:metal-dependent hydrolase [Paenibacillus sp. HN-1]|uniref:metal-dependent hydrolase n=1 Tax=Paenibacillus TaxID=44249 RepID=UPI001CA85910|nr:MULTISPECIES: metal-dependent hydrolase [Paenibacillus]MBY9078410.1 metal-dependent hydrolase [Paenibacillus sp. CGMCC 1.18879]MBY9087875.1 metal-dependent hydrolase [Paenibacillus sinensis]
MQLIYHGHSTIQLITNGQSLIVDPFLSGNQLATVKPEEIKTDAILLTHAHADHILDAGPISKANDAPVIANPELATYLSWNGIKAVGMNIGGTYDLGFATAKMVHAFHSSGIIVEEQQSILYGGMPAGYIITAEGLTVLHAGDTGLFGDMKMIGERHSIDVAFIPIGDHFTMGPEDALQAAAWYNAKLVVPIHYDTFPPIRQDANQFVAQLEASGLQGKVLKPGESLSF